ncbi:MAG: hypothetical protein OEL87_01865 [Nanoarchaeota archaeon]|nr:hypothetical protein [Nanoarchaeota archaeon]
MRQKSFKKKLFFTFVFSIIVAPLAIIHGVFFDLDISQIQRLGAEGFLFTFAIVFVGLLLLEKLFNIEEDEEIINIKKRLNKLEKRRGK